MGSTLSTRLSFDDVEISPDERLVLVSGRPVAVGARAFDLLMCLVEHRERVVDKDELLQEVWPGLVVEESNLSVHVAALRKVVGTQAITTVPGRGYRFTASLNEAASPTNAQVPSAPDAAAMGTSAARNLPDKPTIAVLPFVNLSGDEDQRWFCDGVTDDILSQLTRFKSLYVIARGSSFDYRDTATDVTQVARELDAHYVLQGSVRRSAERVRLSCQLVDASNGACVWAQTYERALQDIFAVQEELTQAIAATVTPQLEAAELKRVSRRRLGDPGAYELAVRAWSNVNDACFAAAQPEASLNQALAWARQALAIDPDHVRSLLAVAVAQSFCLCNMMATDAEAASVEAVDAASRALAIDRDDALALATRALPEVLRGPSENPTRWLSNVARAIELNHCDGWVLTFGAFVEALCGEGALATEHIRLHRRLNPRAAEPRLIENVLTIAAFVSRDYRQGVDSGQRAAHLAPQLPPLRINWILNLVGAGDIERAKAEFRRLQQLAPAFARSRLDGHSIYQRAKDRHRQLMFLRVAAGLEVPSTADALR